MKQLINMTREIITIADVTCYHQHRDHRNVLSCILAVQFSFFDKDISDFQRLNSYFYVSSMILKQI